MQDELLVVFVVLLVLISLGVIGAVIGARSASSPHFTVSDRVAFDDIKVEAQNGILPHAGTYDYVIFSKTGEEERNTIFEIIHCMERGLDQDANAYLLLCRLCMVTNEMNLITAKAGNLAFPLTFATQTRLVGQAISKKEVFGNFMTVEASGICVPIITFRGTASTQDWLVDAKIARCDIAERFNDDNMAGTVHVGFVDLYMSMCTQIVNQINVLLERYGHIEYLILTGHSLGAAIATVAAYHISCWSMGRIKVCLVTFGSPRVGDNRYAASFATKNIYAIRVANSKDGVTAIPGGQYKHVGMRKGIDVLPMYIPLPESYSSHNLYIYMWSFDPNAKDIELAKKFFKLKS